MPSLTENLTTLEMWRGNTPDFLVTLTRDGAPIDLTDVLIVFTAKLSLRDEDDAATTIQKTLTSGITVLSAEDGQALVSFETEDTEDLAQTTAYQFDVKIQEVGGRMTTVLRGVLLVHPDVTRTVAA